MMHLQIGTKLLSQTSPADQIDNSSLHMILHHLNMSVNIICDEKLKQEASDISINFKQQYITL